MVLEQRDCVASAADYVCEWNWCRQISLIYFGYLPVHCFEQLVCSPVGEAHPIKIRKDLG